MNGGVTVYDMDRRRAALEQNEKLFDLLIQAGQVISSLQSDRPAGGILDRIDRMLATRTSKQP